MGKLELNYHAVYEMCVFVFAPIQMFKQELLAWGRRHFFFSSPRKTGDVNFDSIIIFES